MVKNQNLNKEPTRPTTLHLPVSLDDELDQLKERLGISRTAAICRGIQLVAQEFRPMVDARGAAAGV